MNPAHASPDTRITGPGETVWAECEVSENPAAPVTALPVSSA